MKKIVIFFVVAFSSLGNSSHATDELGPSKLEVTGTTSICPGKAYSYSYKYTPVEGDNCWYSKAEWTVKGATSWSNKGGGIEVIWSLTASTRSITLTLSGADLNDQCTKTSKVANLSISSKVPNSRPANPAGITFSNTTTFCPGDIITLTATGSVAGSVYYIWEKSINNGAWTSITSTGGSTRNYTVP
ncbi:hypothetical protein, partial [Fulvivirga kasyanovii]